MEKITNESLSIELCYLLPFLLFCVIHIKLNVSYLSPPVNLPSPQTLMVRLLVSKSNSITHFSNSGDFMWSQSQSQATVLKALAKLHAFCVSSIEQRLNSIQSKNWLEKQIVIKYIMNCSAWFRKII